MKNEEQIMKDIRDIQKKQMAQSAEEQENAAEYQMRQAIDELKARDEAQK